MRTRLLAVAAVLAAGLLPATASAATVHVASDPSGPTVSLSWDATAAVFETVWRASGPCTTLPMAGQTDIDDSTLPTLDTSWTDHPGADGVYCYYVQDDGLASYGTPAQVSVDIDAPTVGMDLVAADVSGTVPVSGTANDTGGSGVASVQFQSSPHNADINNDTWTTFDTETAGSGSLYTGSLDTTALSGDGLYDLRALVTDGAGNTGTSTPQVGVLVDNTHPGVSLTSPLASAKVHGTIAPQATATDSGSGVASVQFQSSPHNANINNDTWTTFDTENTGSGSTYTGSLDTTTLGGDGLYDVRALVTDNADNTFTASATSIVVDNTAPAVAAITSPTPGAALHGTGVSVAATATDSGGSGIASVQFQSSPHGAGTWTTFDTQTTGSGSTYTGTLNTTTLGGDGSYDLRTVVTDGSNNVTTGSTVAGVVVDNTPPTVNLTGVVPSARVSGTVALAATAGDTGGSLLTSVTFGYRTQGSSGAFTTIGSPETTGPFGVSFNTVSLGVPDGSYEIGATAIDGAGNKFTSSATSVIIDNHAPTVPGTPTGLGTVSSAPTITFTGSTDPTVNSVTSGVNHYDVYRDGSKINSAPIPDTGAASYTWSDVTGQSTSPAAGTSSHVYTVLAVDGAGNSSAQSPGLTIVLDPTAASAPTALTAAASPTNQRPQLTWVAPTGAPFTITHYNIYIDGSSTPVVAPTTTFTDASSPNGTHSYQVVAASAGDTQLGVPAGVSVTYDTVAPTTPAGVVATAALDGSVNITWSASSDATSGVARYVVRRALSSTPPATVADGDAMCSGIATSCSDQTALNGKLYTYAVFAVDNAGNVSLAGDSLGVTAHDQTPPPAPAGLVATPGNGTVALSWTAATAADDVAGYVLVAKQGSSAPTSETDGTRVCPEIVSTSSSCVATGLSNGVTYTFGLFALDEALNRSAPALVSAAPNGKVTDSKAPAAVSRLHASVTGTKVTLTWKNPADHDFDHVVITAATRKPDALKATKRLYSGKGTKTTIKLAPGESRWMVVVAYDVAGNASKPASVHVTIPPASPFGPAPHSKVTGTVKLSWPVVKGALYYNVQVYTGKHRVFVSWPAGRAMSLPRAKLKKGRTYTWYVWPGLGTKAKAHYGKLIGKNVFTFTG